MNVSQKLNSTNDSGTCVIILSYNNMMWWADIWTYWKTWHLPLSEHSEWNQTNSLLESLKKKKISRTKWRQSSQRFTYLYRGKSERFRGVWRFWDRASLEQRCKQPTRCNNFRLLIFLLIYVNLLHMFRVTDSPIFRSTFDCIYSFGTMHCNDKLKWKVF